MDIRCKTALLSIILFCLCAFVVTIEAGQVFKDQLLFYEISKDKTYFYLTLTGSTSEARKWLGVSVYPRVFKNLLSDCFHKTVPLKSGRFKLTLKVPLKYWGGHFDIAIWSKRIPKEMIKISNPWVEKLGGKYSGLAAFGRGCTIMRSGSLQNYFR
ncbi:hypothetical protein ACFL35_08735 [Candidatus Riflebacteria bacterium]